ncbi:MAG: hypothetical protein EBU90_12070 [Proteobacteria bacterium]|nr:hypothetical protein [Pseudomonadota bacterium]NBP14815.1 hypothetical protein [bacterium]
MPALPGTGSELSFGRVYKAYTNVAVNSAGDADPSGSVNGGSQNIKLSQILGTYPTPPKSAGAQISFSATFGGQNAPYTY